MLAKYKYTLDIKIDDLGQYTESMKLIIPNSVAKLVNKHTINGFGDYIDFLYFNNDTIISQLENKDWINEQKESYIKNLRNYGSFEAKNGFPETHPQSFVPKPYLWEKEDKELSLKGASFNQKIFETTFSGIKAGSGSIITRVDDSFVGFRLDSPDTKGKNITIEGK